MMTWEERAHGVFSLLVDGEEKKRVSSSIVSRAALVQLPLNEALWTKLAELEFTGGLRYAITQLARRSLHSKMLQKKLQRLFVQGEVSAKILEYCQAKGFINDEEWLASAAHYWQSRGKSSAQIRARLLAEGIVYRGPLNDHAALARCIAKSYPELQDADLPYLKKAKILRALQRRGFPLEQIQAFLERP